MNRSLHLPRRSQMQQRSRCRKLVPKCSKRRSEGQQKKKCRRVVQKLRPDIVKHMVWEGHFGPFWSIWALGSSGKLLANLGSFGSVLGMSWEPLWGSWAPLGTSLGPLGSLWGRLGGGLGGPPAARPPEDIYKNSRSTALCGPYYNIYIDIYIYIYKIQY